MKEYVLKRTENIPLEYVFRVIVDYSHISVYGYQNSDIQIGQQFRME
jgi:hypothetical protein